MMAGELRQQPLFEVKGLGHAYGSRQIFADLDLRILPGERLAVVGPSGCGKSTLLRLCAGLEEARDGQVIHPAKGHAVVFQDPTLLPWKRTDANIALGLRARGVGRAESLRRARELAQTFGLTADDMTKFPRQLSGGMQCRAALARAFVLDPPLVFLDEPFSALDVGWKADCHARLEHQPGTAVFLITHDLMEAVRVADRILLLGPAGEGWRGEFPNLLSEEERHDEMIIHARTLDLLARPEVRRCFDLDGPSRCCHPPRPVLP